MNTAPARSLACAAAVAALLLSPIPSLAEPPHVIPPGHARQAGFKVIKNYADGPWLVPTLHALRSANDWNLQMAKWLADEQVVGREAAPDVDWSHEAVIVVSLGKQVGNCTLTVNECMVDGDITVMDLHLTTPTQWDPNGDVVHPAVLIAVDREDLKNLEIRTDCTVDGLPGGANRRGGNGATLALQPTGSDASIAPAGVDATTTLEAATTWGRVKDAYRR